MSVKKISVAGRSFWEGFVRLSTLGRPITKIPEYICPTRLLLDFKYIYITILKKTADVRCKIYLVIDFAQWGSVGLE